MFRRLCGVFLIFPSIALPAQGDGSVPSDSSAVERLFDGESLQGWHGAPGLWRVEDGCIVGSTVGVERRRTTYLFWEGADAADFELTFDVRVDGNNNSGVHYRSRELANFDVAGYQCDVHGAPNYFGMFYEEKGAAVLCQHGQFVARGPDGGNRVVGRIAQPGKSPADLAKWHTFKVVARGNVIQHYVDGRLAAMVMDDRREAPRSGKIALQVHGGPPMTVWFRNLVLKRLPAVEVAKLPPLADALLARERGAKSTGPRPQWIWDASTEGEEDVFFRREFDVEGKVAAATVRAVCDNHWRIYVNGERVVQGDDWTVATTTDITDQLRPGRNVIAVHGWNDGGPAGLALRATWTTAAGTDVLVSDRDWRCSDDDPDGWNDVEFQAEGWPSATVLAALGARKAVWSRTLDADSLAGEAAPDAPQVALPALGLAGPGADGALELLQVPKAYGSWVSLCADDRGRLYASDQSRGLYRITPAAGIGEESTIERVEVELDGAQGLCWFEGALYAVVAVRSPGFYRVRDTDGDDRLDQVELLREFSGTGEHGPHAVVPAPDGKNLILVIGNHVKPTEFSKGGPSYVWGEDRLLPKIEDPRGHARGRKAPGGYICRIDPDGKECELLCWGFRNTYDVAVLPDGRLYTYDADMEWDMGMPWYRPTRILEVVKGADYGWRSGSNKWPVDYPDSPIAVCDIGPGSPTGMVTHGGSVLALDWTFGTIYALPIGSREPVQWVTGQPFPVSDAVSVDGKLYVVTGGRGLRTRLLRIDATPPQQTATAMPMAERGDRRELERLRGVLRYTSLDARTVLARLGESRFDFAEMDSEERVSWLRVHALALLRIESVDQVLRRDLGARLLPLFPCGDGRVDADLAELLAFLDVPGLLEKAVPTLSPMRPAKPPEWAEVVKRNSSYGGAIQKMLDNMPPTPQIAIAYALRTVKHGWTLEQRRAFFTFLTEARTRSGGASYDGYLGKIIDAAWETCSPAEQSALAELVDKARAELPSFRATPPRGPGRDWQLGDAVAFVRGDTGKRDLAAGHNLFHAVGCASCHYFAGEGGNHGPDLTSLGNKFSAEEVIEAIIAPDRVISDQYAAVVVTKTDGTVILGRANSVDRGGVKYWDVVPAVAQAELQRIPASEVASVEPSKQSPMPAGLVDALSPGELRDLVAFLLSRGVR